VAWGGRLTVHGRSGTLDAGVERIEPGSGDDLGSVNTADARLCVFTSRLPGSTVGICGNGRVEDGLIRRADKSVIQATTVYGGLLIGVGIH
jgi:hypothetical protein